MLTLTGGLTAKADQTAKATTKAEGATEAGGGATLAATISFALTSADHLTEATIGRNVIAGGPVSLTAEGVSTTATTAEASAAGAEAEDDSSGTSTGKDTTGKDVNQKSDKKLGKSATRNSGGAGGGTTTPEAKDDSGTKVSVAAGIAFNIVKSTVTAELGNGWSLSTPGTASFIARNDTDASATAKGTATNSTQRRYRCSGRGQLGHDHHARRRGHRFGAHRERAHHHG